MKTLSQLIRLHRFRLLARQKALNALEAEAHDLEARRLALETEVAIEYREAETSALGTLGFDAYLRRTGEKRETLITARKAVDGRIATARAALRAAFQEVKKIEILRERQQEEQRLAKLQAEQAFLDEVAVTRHGRELRKSG